MSELSDVPKAIREFWDLAQDAGHGIDNLYGDISPIWGGDGRPAHDQLADADWFPGSQLAPDKQIARMGMVPQKIRGTAGIAQANADQARQQAMAGYAH